MDIIEIIILITIAISGTVFGSFFTLAVHRIPQKQDITHERSYCPKCNHKLQFLDLIPVFSYIFLGGKCRYCKEKIRPRYLILEIFSGLVFLLLGISYAICLKNNYNSSLAILVSRDGLKHCITLALIILFFCATFIIAGIDKEKYIIPNSLIIYGLCIAILKNIFEYFVIGNSIYNNIVGFIFIPLVLLIINLCFKKLFNKEEPFGMGDIKYIAVIGLFGGFSIQILTILLSVILILVHKFLNILQKHIHDKLKENKKTEIAFGFYLSIAVTILLIVAPHISSLLEVIDFMVKVS